MKKVKDYMVLRIDNYIGVTMAKNFENIAVCKTYDQYGCTHTDECECGLAENYKDNNMEKEFLGEHYEVEAWNFWNGSNWNTIRLDDPGIEIIEGDEKEEIINELPETPWIEGTYEEVETDNHTYLFTRFAEDPWIARVDVLE